jgi:hypothetical protein
MNKQSLSENGLKAVCSVTELAGILGFSRTRFYQLQKMGVFPMPVFCIRTKRPFYPLDLQKKCIEIRKTGIAHNGQPFLFYGERKDRNKASWELSESEKGSNKNHQKYEEFTNTLRRMGLNVSCKAVENAINELFPEGLEQHFDEGQIVRDLFRYLTAKL